MSDALPTLSTINTVVDDALRTLPTLEAKMSLLTQGNPKAHYQPLAQACEVATTTVQLWVNGRTKKLNRKQIPKAAAYFRVRPESLVVANPERKSAKPRTEPSRPHHGTLNYHLEALAVGKAHYVEVPVAQSIQWMQSRIQSAFVKLPGSMENMQFKTAAHTCIGSTIGAPVRYVIRVERTK